MGYRIQEKKHPEPRRDVQNTSSPSTVFIQNGTRFHYAIPCWYLIAEEPVRSHYHSREHHDHVGWPSPSHPDHICQDYEFAHSCHAHEVKGYHHDRCRHYLDMQRLSPIHLLKEGYTDIDIAFDNKPDGLSAVGYIDNRRDWVVRIVIDSFVQDAIEDRIEVPYSIFASGANFLCL